MGLICQSYAAHLMAVAVQGDDTSSVTAEALLVPGPGR